MIPSQFCFLVLGFSTVTCLIRALFNFLFIFIFVGFSNGWTSCNACIIKNYSEKKQFLLMLIKHEVKRTRKKNLYKIQVFSLVFGRLFFFFLLNLFFFYLLIITAWLHCVYQRVRQTWERAKRKRWEITAACALCVIYRNHHRRRRRQYYNFLFHRNNTCICVELENKTVRWLPRNSQFN